MLVRLHGSGGHTSRPHLTEDVVFALSQVATQLPAILSRRLNGLPAVGVMAVSITVCALIYVPIAAVGWPTAIPSVEVIEAIVILAVVCTAAAFLVFAALIDEIGPVRATVITYVNPAVAAVLGVAVLKETLTPAMIAGFGLVIVGSMLATRRPAAAARSIPEPATNPA